MTVLVTNLDLPARRGRIAVTEQFLAIEVVLEGRVLVTDEALP